MKTCYDCNAAVPFDRVGPRDVCEKCESHLHCCRNCVHYDPRASHQCREPEADLVADKEAGNFCDFFRFEEDRPAEKDGYGRSVLHDLERLFRRRPPPTDPER